jgi:nucleotide-binding universal stress UspA family protein
MEAVRWAADEATWRRRPLRILCALGSADPQLCGPAWRLIDNATAQVRLWQPQVRVTGLVRPGTPTAELCAESARAELVVLGSRGRGATAGLLLGSVSAQVAAHARCPVLVVHGAQARTEYGASSSQRPVLVGVDGSEAADLAAELAFEEAAARDVAVLAARAWQPPHQPWRSDVRLLVLDVAEIETAEQHLLRESVAEWRAKYPWVSVQLRLVPGSPGAVLVSLSQNAQMAVVASRGNGGFAGLLLGSTSQQLLHHAHCPVLVVRRPEVLPSASAPAGAREPPRQASPQAVHVR